MSMEAQKAKRGLAATLTSAFLRLSITVLFIAGGIEVGFNLRAEQRALSSQQQVVAIEAANAVSGFIQEKFSVLEAAIKFSNPTSASRETQERTLENLLVVEDAIYELALLDSQGSVLVEDYGLSRTSGEATITSRIDEFFDQVGQGERYISQIYVDIITSEPMIIIAVPAIDAFGDFQGALAAEVNLKFMWDLVDKLEIGEEGQAYVVNKQGTLIAFSDSSRILRGENVSQLKEVNEFINSTSPVDTTGAALSLGINDTLVASTYVPLGYPDWAVVIELPWLEAYQGLIGGTVFSIAFIVILAIWAGLRGRTLARQLAIPLISLTETADQITKGDHELEAAVEGPHEIARLATAFNSMTSQLRHSINTLEKRVTDRTRRLEVVATLGEQLNAILDANDLLREVVKQTQENFGYYHVQIYLLDEAEENLTLAAASVPIPNSKTCPSWP